MHKQIPITNQKTGEKTITKIIHQMRMKCHRETIPLQAPHQVLWMTTMIGFWLRQCEKIREQPWKWWDRHTSITETNKEQIEKKGKQGLANTLTRHHSCKIELHNTSPLLQYHHCSPGECLGLAGLQAAPGDAHAPPCPVQCTWLALHTNSIQEQVIV